MVTVHDASTRQTKVSEGSHAESLRSDGRTEHPERSSIEAEELQRPSRRDALPEHTHYVDSGCDLHPSCLTCPLVRCRYDEPGGVRRVLSDARDARILRLRRDEQLPVELIATRFGVSRRTVFRVLARARDQGT